MNLCFNAANKVAIAEAGAIAPLVLLLQGDCTELNAASAERVESSNSEGGGSRSRRVSQLFDSRR